MWARFGQNSREELFVLVRAALMTVIFIRAVFLVSISDAQAMLPFVTCLALDHEALGVVVWGSGVNKQRDMKIEGRNKPDSSQTHWVMPGSSSSSTGTAPSSSSALGGVAGSKARASKEAH